MIIDLILDRRDGCNYDPSEFVESVREYIDIFPDTDAATIVDAFENKVEQAVKHALCGYILTEGYNPEICDYINSVSWLPDWWDMD